MRFENDTQAALLELERQRTREIYESAQDYRCEHGCAAEDVFFAGEHVFCEKCLVEYVQKSLAEIIELARLTDAENTEVFDLLADMIEDMSDDTLLNYAQYYYSRVM